MQGVTCRLYEHCFASIPKKFQNFAFLYAKSPFFYKKFQKFRPPEGLPVEISRFQAEKSPHEAGLGQV